jgi:hypothetical protein
MKRKLPSTPAERSERERAHLERVCARRLQKKTGLPYTTALGCIRRGVDDPREALALARVNLIAADGHLSKIDPPREPPAVRKAGKKGFRRGESEKERSLRIMREAERDEWEGKP